MINCLVAFSEGWRGAKLHQRRVVDVVVDMTLKGVLGEVLLQPVSELSIFVMEQFPNLGLEAPLQGLEPMAATLIFWCMV